jgi:hypothetical protein
VALEKELEQLVETIIASDLKQATELSSNMDLLEAQLHDIEDELYQMFKRS